MWAAFDAEKLVGFLTGEVGGGYWLETGDGKEATCFINEFVVDSSYRGKRIGVNLTSMSIDPQVGIWAIHRGIKEMYATVHVDNVISR